MLIWFFSLPCEMRRGACQELRRIQSCATSPAREPSPPIPQPADCSPWLRSCVEFLRRRMRRSVVLFSPHLVSPKKKAAEPAKPGADGGSSGDDDAKRRTERNGPAVRLRKRATRERERDFPREGDSNPVFFRDNFLTYVPLQQLARARPAKWGIRTMGSAGGLQDDALRKSKWICWSLLIFQQFGRAVVPSPVALPSGCRGSSGTLFRTHHPNPRGWRLEPSQVAPPQRSCALEASTCTRRLHSASPLG